MSLIHDSQRSPVSERVISLLERAATAHSHALGELERRVADAEARARLAEARAATLDAKLRRAEAELLRCGCAARIGVSGCAFARLFLSFDVCAPNADAGLA